MLHSGTVNWRHAPKRLEWRVRKIQAEGCTRSVPVLRGRPSVSLFDIFKAKIPLLLLSFQVLLKGCVDKL